MSISICLPGFQFYNKNRQKAILTGLPIFVGEGGLCTLRPPGLSLTIA